MTPVVPENENEDPEVDVSAMVAEVGAESVATVVNQDRCPWPDR